MNTVLVSGCAGFIGFHAAKALLEKGIEVVGVDDLNDYYSVQLKKDRLGNLQPYEKFRFVQADLSDEGAVRSLFEGTHFDAVLHLAAQPGVRYALVNPFAYQRSNVQALVNVLEYSARNDVTKFVFASSSSVYGDSESMPFREDAPLGRPLSLYAATKQFGESACTVYQRTRGLKCVMLRFFTVYGPWGRPDMAVYKFTDAVVKGRMIEVYGSTEMRRDFSFIDDIVNGILAAMEYEGELEVFNLGRGKSVSVAELIGYIEEATGKKAKVKVTGYDKSDMRCTWADVSKARRLLGFTPSTDIREGVRSFVEWYGKYHTGEEK